MHPLPALRLRFAHLLASLLVSLPVILLPLLPLPAHAQQPVAPAAPEAPAAVEHWIGTGVVDGHLEYATLNDPLWMEPEVVDGYSTIDYDLYVNAAGAITGRLNVRWFAANQLQRGAQACNPAASENSYYAYDCVISLEPTDGGFTLNVTGTRTRDATGKVIFKLVDTAPPAFRAWRKMVGTQPVKPPYVWTHRAPSRAALIYPPNIGMEFGGMPVPTYGRVLVEETRNITYTYGCCVRENRTFQVAIYEVGTEPTLRLDKELLERSVFMDRVSVPNALTANLNWSTAGGGSTAWRLPAGPETTPISPATTVPRSVDVGATGVGEHTVTVKGKDSLDRQTIEEIVKIAIATYYDRCPSFTASKQGKVVVYKCEVKVPDKPFKARVDNVWDVIPYFGGKPLGLGEVQFTAALELKSTGEGSVAGSAGTNFAAMGGAVGGNITIKGDLVLEETGARFVAGSIEIAVAGEIEKTEPLITVVPALKVPMVGIRRLLPAAADYLEKSLNLTLKLGPKIAPTLNLINDPKPEIGWKFAPSTIPASVAFDLSLNAEPMPGKLKLKTGLGGSLTLTIEVPPNPDYLKSLEGKFLVYAEVTVLDEWSGRVENEWTWSSVAAAMTEGGIDAAQTLAGLPLTRISRSYLTTPGYSAWVGVAPQYEEARGPLVERVGPQARPAYLAYDSARQYMVWSYDEPGSGADNGEELALANLSGNLTYRPPNGYTLLTNDDRADLNPQLAKGTSTAMVVWERMDTATPGDFVAAPEAYLSHLQVAAAPISLTTNLPVVTPVQISNSGAINHRPQAIGFNSGGDVMLAVWITNPANLLQGDATSPDQFVYALYNRFTKTWSAPQLIPGTIPGIQSFDIASGNDGSNVVALVYSADADGSSATANDTEVYYTEFRKPQANQPGAWSAFTRLTNNGVNESDVQIAYLPDANDDSRPHLIWRAGNQAFYVGGAWNAPPQPFPFTLPDGAGTMDLAAQPFADTLLLAWPQNDGVATMRLAPTTQGWSLPRIIPAPGGAGTPESATVPTFVRADFAPEPMIVAMTESNTPTTRNFNGSAYALPETTRRDLFAVNDPTRPLSLTIEAGSVNVQPTAQGADASAPAAPDAPAVVSATIRNLGDEPAADVRVSIVQRPVGQPVQTLAAITVSVGGGATLPVALTLNAPPAGDLPRQLVVEKYRCSGTYCQVQSADSALLPVDAVAVAGGATQITPHATVASLKVRQQGLLPHAAPMRVEVRSGPNGPILNEVGVSLPSTRTVVAQVTAAITPTLLGPGEHIVWWEIVSDGPARDLNPGNNFANSLVVVLPDLYINPYLTRVTGASVFARVQNVGNWPSGATVLEVWSAPPATAGAIKLGSIAVPALAPGAHADLNGAVATAETAETADLQATRAAYLLLDPANTVTEINENNDLIAIAGTTATVAQGQLKVYLPTVKR
jgi:hypothetical protein